jgi:hypothetical protein
MDGENKGKKIRKRNFAHYGGISDLNKLRSSDTEQWHVKNYGPYRALKDYEKVLGR